MVNTEFGFCCLRIVEKPSFRTSHFNKHALKQAYVTPIPYTLFTHPASTCLLATAKPAPGKPGLKRSCRQFIGSILSVGTIEPFMTTILKTFASNKGPSDDLFQVFARGSSSLFPI
jgi:hypothetical protein